MFDEVDEGVFEYTFDTAWSPPCAWLRKVAQDWPDLEFKLLYWEGGMCFGGYLKIKGDEVEECEVSEDELREFVIENFGIDPFGEEDDE